MNFVVEFEGFPLSNKFIIKEACIRETSDVPSIPYQHFLIKSPFSIKKLTYKDRRTVKFCEKLLHRIKWSMGDCVYGDFVFALNSIPEGSLIYTKGLQKVKLLESIRINSSGAIRNLEDLGCVPITKQQKSLSNTCPISFHREMYNCSHEKSMCFVAFLKNHERKTPQ